MVLLDKFSARKIARAASLAANFFQHLLEKSVHVFASRRMLRKQQVAPFRSGR
jgi:hypothetical protein